MKKYTIYFVVLALLAGCSSKVYQPSRLNYTGYKISSGSQADPSVTALLKVYSDSVNSTMNGVIGYAAEPLSKAQPEGSLGNIMADAMLEGAKKQYNKKVDAAFMNSGGIRLTQIAAGPITTGKIFELMPFDNVLVLQDLTGIQLQAFMDHISSRGGWPSAGITYDIQNEKAVHVLVNGKPIDPAVTYTIANGDYVANGGDDCVMLKTIPQLNKGILVRDVLIDYVKQQTAANKKLSGKLEGRVKAL